MIKVERFVNQLMTSNCYVVYDDDTLRCLVIDPASEKSEREIAFIEGQGLSLDYIILTHEHTDHNWGVNALRSYFPSAKLVCSEACNKLVKRTNKAYFLFYFDDPNYRYEIAPAEVLIINSQEQLDWNELRINFTLTPGHSYGSMCIDIDGMLFTGDTIMPYKPYFNGRDSNEDDWQASVSKIDRVFPEDITIYPGHGDTLSLRDWKLNYL